MKKKSAKTLSRKLVSANSVTPRALIGPGAPGSVRVQFRAQRADARFPFRSAERLGLFVCRDLARKFVATTVWFEAVVTPFAAAELRLEPDASAATIATTPRTIPST